MPTVYDVYALVMPTCVGDDSAFQMFLLIITMLTPVIFVFLIGLWVFTLNRRLFLFTLSTVLNALFNWLLKVIIRAPRPEPPCLPSFGMPSGHAQFAFGVLTYVVLEGTHWYTHLCRHHYRCGWHLELPHPIWTALLVATWAVFVAISRVVLGYHTTAQVVVGALVGVAFTLTFYLLASTVKRQWYDRHRSYEHRADAQDSGPRAKAVGFRFLQSVHSH